MYTKNKKPSNNNKFMCYYLIDTQIYVIIYINIIGFLFNYYINNFDFQKEDLEEIIVLHLLIIFLSSNLHKYLIIS